MEVEEVEQTEVRIDEPSRPDLSKIAPAPIAPGVELEPIAEPAVTTEPQIAPEQEEVFRYEVQQGDTLNAIARRYGLTVAQLVATNDITDERIFPGQKLIILAIYLRNRY